MKPDMYVDNLFKQKVIEKAAIASFLNRWPGQWQWFASLSLGGERKPAYFAEKNLRRWRTQMSISSKIQIAYLGLLNHRPYSHLHVFLFGHNKVGETLLSKDPTPWEKDWPENATIEPIYQQEGAIGYLVEKNLPIDQYELLNPYGMKHLKRFEKRA